MDELGHLGGPEGEAPGPHVPGGRLRRMSRLAYLTARTGGDLLAAQVRRKLGGSDAAGGRDEARRAAERILSTLGELKGVALKLGQALAMDPDALPAEARPIVARLLAQAPRRMPFALVARVVEQELGAPPGELFASFDLEPLAAASLGQVHAARLPASLGGAEVVVKVQYPGVEEAVEDDLAVVGSMVRGLSLGGEALDGRAAYQAVKASLLRELDYREEAAQARAYARAARGYPELAVPAVIAARSARRVLTLTRLTGCPLLELMESKDTSGEERFRVGRLLVFAVWGPFLGSRLLHADPHPGNFLALPDGRLGVLDFGATQELSAPFHAAFRELLESQARGEPRPAVMPLLRRAGFRFSDAGAGERKVAAFVERLADIVERPARAEGGYDFGQDSLVRDARRLFQREPVTALAVRPPPESVLFSRAAGGLVQDLCLLRARGRFRDVLAEMLAREPEAAGG